MAIGAMLTMSLIPTLALGASQTLQVTAHVNARVAVSATADGVMVQANTPWRLVVQTDRGTQTISGQKTAGTAVRLPDGTLAYWIASE